MMLASLPDFRTGGSEVKHVLTVLGHLWLTMQRLTGMHLRPERNAEDFLYLRIHLSVNVFGLKHPLSDCSRPDASRKKLDDWCYLPCWKETSRAPLGAEVNVSKNTTVLLFSDNSGIAAQLAQRLKKSDTTS